MAFEDMGTEVQKGKELNWNSTINQDKKEFVPLPNGEYNFTVLTMTRARHTQSSESKLPDCPEADLDIEVSDGTQKIRIKHRLFLHSRCEGFLAEFFTAIGLKKKGEPLVMDWSKVPGATGRCYVSQQKYQGKTFNKITEFYSPAKKTYQTGTF